MAFLNHNLGFLTSSFLLLSLPFLVLSLSPSPSTSDDRHRRPAPGDRSSTALVLDSRHRRGFHVVTPAPFPRSDPGLHRPIDGNGEGRKRRRRRRRKRKHSRRRDDLGAGSGASAFSAMLPRGFVPPSDSTWCHNDAPDAVELFCDDKYTSGRP